MTPPAIRIVRPREMRDIEAEHGPDEMYYYHIQGQKVVAPWWADTAVIDRHNRLKVFPGIPYRNRIDGEWRSADCEGFKLHGLVVAEVEVEAGREGCAHEFITSLSQYVCEEPLNENT